MRQKTLTYLFQAIYWWPHNSHHLQPSFFGIHLEGLDSIVFQKQAFQVGFIGQQLSPCFSEVDVFKKDMQDTSYKYTNKATSLSKRGESHLNLHSVLSEVLGKIKHKTVFSSTRTSRWRHDVPTEFADLKNKNGSDQRFRSWRSTTIRSSKICSCNYKNPPKIHCFLLKISPAVKDPQVSYKDSLNRFQDVPGAMIRELERLPNPPQEWPPELQKILRETNKKMHSASPRSPISPPLFSRFFFGMFHHFW